jgi:hypothetical protein
LSLQRARCLNYYNACSDSDWKRTLKVEDRAVKVANLIAQYGAQPTASALPEAYEMLLDIEWWKAMCLEERIGNAGHSPQQLVWNAFRGALDSKNDRDCILLIMQLKGFGSTTNDDTGVRGAKVASALFAF